MLVVTVLCCMIAGSAAASTPPQQVRCFDNRTKVACTTDMRLVCHAPGTLRRGRTTLSGIPRTAFWGGHWHAAIGWDGSPTGPFHKRVEHGRLSVLTAPQGGRPDSAEAQVDLHPRAQPSVDKEIIIDTRCTH
jgi:hypothetical protein